MPIKYGTRTRVLCKHDMLESLFHVAEVAGSVEEGGRKARFSTVPHLGSGASHYTSLSEV